MINPATFILMIIIGASPPQQSGEFHSYHHCYEAAHREIENLGADVRWDCVLKHETASGNSDLHRPRRLVEVFRPMTG